MSIPFNDNIPDSKADDVYRIVNSLFENRTLTEYFMTLLGVSLFTNKHEKLNILTGSGRNGKSLIMNWLSSILNDYATVAETDLLTTKIRNGICCSLVNAKNTRMMLVSEPSNDDYRETKLNDTLIKTLTGRDPITARSLYRNTITIKPTFNVFMLCNEIPSLESVDQAMVERLNIVKFNFTFAEEERVSKQTNNRRIDTDLKSKLHEDTELKQAFINILFQYAFANIDKNIPAPKAFAA
jgi:phage/plasmid-associated DNA primase